VAVGGGILGIVAVAYPAGMGGGDVKFMAMAGAFLGWLGAMIALFVASLAGAVVGIVLLAMGRIGRRDPIVFGPFLSLGIVVAIFLGPAILQNKLIWPIFIQAG
jgi:leader peptidase (prepilin peptidase)/N-methyltransferase